jgi:hypothetical protein
VLLHSDDCSPSQTLQWLRLRPYLTRHHHVRLNAAADISRLWRWVSGKAVGLVLSGAHPPSPPQPDRHSAFSIQQAATVNRVLTVERKIQNKKQVLSTGLESFHCSICGDPALLEQWCGSLDTAASLVQHGLVPAGGGSRGLAHLGVLQAIREVGVPVDVVGGTSQGAFIGGLFAQGLSNDDMFARVRAFATLMSSPRHLLSDVTLPILSLFSGHQFDRVCSLGGSMSSVCSSRL